MQSLGGMKTRHLPAGPQQGVFNRVYNDVLHSESGARLSANGPLVSCPRVDRLHRLDSFWISSIRRDCFVGPKLSLPVKRVKGPQREKASPMPIVQTVEAEPKP